MFCRVGDKNLDWTKILEAVVGNQEPSRRKVLSEAASCPRRIQMNAQRPSKVKHSQFSLSAPPSFQDQVLSLSHRSTYLFSNPWPALSPKKVYIGF